MLLKKKKRHCAVFPALVVFSLVDKILACILNPEFSQLWLTYRLWASAWAARCCFLGWVEWASGAEGLECSDYDLGPPLVSLQWFRRSQSTCSQTLCLPASSWPPAWRLPWWPASLPSWGSIWSNSLTSPPLLPTSSWVSLRHPPARSPHREAASAPHTMSVDWDQSNSPGHAAPAAEYTCALCADDLPAWSSCLEYVIIKH